MFVLFIQMSARRVISCMMRDFISKVKLIYLISEDCKLYGLGLKHFEILKIADWKIMVRMKFDLLFALLKC